VVTARSSSSDSRRQALSIPALECHDTASANRNGLSGEPRRAFPMRPGELAADVERRSHTNILTGSKIAL